MLKRIAFRLSLLLNAMFFGAILMLASYIAGIITAEELERKTAAAGKKAAEANRFTR